MKTTVVMAALLLGAVNVSVQAENLTECVVTWEEPVCYFSCPGENYTYVSVWSEVWSDPVSIIASCGSGAQCMGIAACEVTWYNDNTQPDPNGICSMTWAGLYPSGDWGYCAAFV